MNQSTVDDFLGMEFRPEMGFTDYLKAMNKVEILKYMYEEEDDLVAEQDKEYCIKKQERITHNIKSLLSSFQPVQPVKHVDPQPLAFVVPKHQRSLQPNVRPRKITEEFFFVKKAVENNSEEQEKPTENRAKVSTENRDMPLLPKIKINYWGNKFVTGKPHGKEPIDPLGFTNEEFFKITNFVKSSLAKREREDKEVTVMEKKKVKRNNAPLRINNQLSRELPIEFKNVITNIGGSLESAVVVIEKTLFLTDVKREEGRLSIPVKQVWDTKFIKPEEDQHLNTPRNGGGMSEIRVKLIEPSCKISEINLRKWNMDKANGKPPSSMYVLVTYWNDVVKRNQLRTGNLVQLWAFRKDSELCFALVKVRD